MSQTPKSSEEQDQGGKRAQILAGARKVFFARSFAGASMGEIARAAGVSKGTLYVYFDSKDTLFQALIEEQKRNTAERIATFDPEPDDLEAALTCFAARLMTGLAKPEHIALVRIIIGAAGEFPALGRSFFESGPAFGARRLADWIEAQEARGLIRTDHAEDAAWRFLGMCNAPVLTAAMLGGDPPPDEEIERRAKGIARAFLAELTVLKRGG